MTIDDIHTILAALYALNNEQETYQYRVKLACQILHSMTIVPGKPKQELPDKLKAIINDGRISAQTEKKLHILMGIVSGVDIDDILSDYGIEEDSDIRLFHALEELYQSWAEDGQRNQIEMEMV